MTDRPLPPEAPSASAPEPTPASGPLAPEAAPSRQRRPWTFLGRIARALREQNWAAVAVELVIVVLGIVIGFQVTAWGQQRANRTQELAYLRQLAADLAETERLADQSTADNASGDRALTRLIQASYARRLAPRDSVLRWFRRSTALSEAVPVLGTAEALVTTGDLVLLRDDSLRSAVTAYVEASRRLLDQQGDLRALWFESHERMRRLDDRLRDHRA
ncbi:MAG TPA: hypothetical protein EYQ24_06800 [Bacteroidetes bacterium]|nr:hypothetical protein [Bacteroidota bacterium]